MLVTALVLASSHILQSKTEVIKVQLAVDDCM
jgi:hypothetical protein